MCVCNMLHSNICVNCVIDSLPIFRIGKKCWTIREYWK